LFIFIFHITLVVTFQIQSLVKPALIYPVTDDQCNISSGDACRSRRRRRGSGCDPTTSKAGTSAGGSARTGSQRICGRLRLRRRPSAG